MTLDAAAARYWNEAGQHASEPDLFRNIERIVDWIGGSTALADITTEMVSGLVARRRGETVKGNPGIKLVSPSTVNRSFTMVLRRILTRARVDWQIPLQELRWKSLILKEPKERVRELRLDEEDRLEQHERPEFTALRRFTQATGLRRRDALITWPQVDWDAEVIRVVQKGDDPHEIPLTPDIVEILWALYTAADRHETHVFTYIALKTRVEPRSKRKIIAGERYPITEEGWATEHGRVCKRADVEGFRIHDERHTAATRLLRGSGNLKVVQKVMGHKSITTTMKYAHINDGDIRAAMRARAADEAARRQAYDDRKKALKKPEDESQGGEKPKGPRSLAG
ncbi:tyrosine-type recombinase/integrase [Hansschlegelia beijingensis]